MIKFFRHIRQSLIMENKTGKYLKYAIGEIVLVVIGILIALQVNDWNESRKQRLAEKDFMKGVVNDLQQDKAYIDVILESLERKTTAYELLDPKSIGKQTDSLLGAYLFFGQGTFYPVSGSFQSALAGNVLNTFKDKEAVGLMIKLYNSTYPRLIDNAGIIDERWSDLSQKYIHQRRIGKFEELDTEMLSLLMDDIYFHYIQAVWYKTRLLNAADEIDMLLNKLDD